MNGNDRRELRATEWQPTGWWRAVRLDTGTVWAEATDEADVRSRAELASMPVVVQRRMQRIERRWEDA